MSQIRFSHNASKTTAIFLLLCLFFASGLVYSEPKQVITQGKIDFRFDVVRLTGRSLTDLMGTKLGFIQVLAADENGLLSPIPFQIDERFRSGAYDFIKNRFPETGVLTAKDELLFMARDAGSRVFPDRISERYSLVKEVEIVEPLTRQKAWAYIVVHDIPPLNAMSDYINYDASSRIVFGQNYLLRFSSPDQQRPLWQANKMKLNWGVEDEGLVQMYRPENLSVDLLEQEVLEINLAAIQNLFDWKFKIKNLNANDVGHRHGLVRVLKKIRLHPKLAFNLTAEPVTIHQKFYNRFAETDISGELTSNLLALFSKIDVQFGETYSDEFIYEPMNVTSKFNEHVIGLRILPKQSDVGPNPQQSFLLVRLITSEANRGAFFKTVDVDNQTFSFGMDVKKLSDGPFYFRIQQFFPQREADFSRFINMADQPLKVRVSEVKSYLVIRPGRQ